jgi:hypothetical protein
MKRRSILWSASLVLSAASLSVCGGCGGDDTTEEPGATGGATSDAGKDSSAATGGAKDAGSGGSNTGGSNTGGSNTGGSNTGGSNTGGSDAGAGGSDAGAGGSDAGAGGSDAGGSDAGTITDAGNDGATSTIQYDFETAVDGWTTPATAFITGLAISAEQAFTGTHSLAVALSGTSAAGTEVYVDNPPGLTNANTVRFHVYVPANVKAVQAYSQPLAADGGWGWNAQWVDITAPTTGQWLTIILPVDPTAASTDTVGRLGFKLYADDTVSGTLYVDSISWGGASSQVYYGFETGTQGWAPQDATLVSSVATSTAYATEGTLSLALTLNGTAKDGAGVQVDSPPGLTNASQVKLKVWVPAGITAIQPYGFVVGADGGWIWNDTYYGTVTADAWNTVVLLPLVSEADNLVVPRIGVKLYTADIDAPLTGTAYIDEVSW